MSAERLGLFKSSALLPAIFLMGPTGAGKTKLAVELVSRLPCRIISVDSAMIYRGMDIGTAKPEKDVLARAPHQLIDICDPAETYSMAQFRTDALREMKEVIQAGYIPLLVGGTGLYFRALQYGISDLPAADPEVRAQIEAAAEKQGWAALYRRLTKIDAKAAARIHPHDSQRIQRALEVYEISGKTMTELISRPTKRPLPHRIIKLMLAPADRTFLHDRLRTRFLGMLKQGLVEEVKGLYERSDLHPSLPAMRLVGYRQVWQYLDGSLDLNTMVEQIIIATRQLAKCQLTWLRSERNTKWFDCEDQALLQAVLRYLNQYLR